MSRKSDGCFVIDLFVLLDAYHMLNSSEVEEKAGELRVAACKEHKLQRRVHVLDQLAELLFTQVVRTSIIGLKHETVRTTHRRFVSYAMA